MKNELFVNVCLTTISILNLYNIIINTDSKSKTISMLIAVICVLYYFVSFYLKKNSEA